MEYEEDKKVSQHFSKPERITSKKLISEVFDSGFSFIQYPFRISYLSIDSGMNQVLSKPVNLPILTKLLIS
jgi:hypothetical protein